MNDELNLDSDPFISKLHGIIRCAVKFLALIMTFVIIFGVCDVLWVLGHRLLSPPFMLLQISDILATFGAFMAVLIAIEIFVNITIYLRQDVIHVKIVMATALMAIARKVIILDFKELSPAYIFALAAVILTTGITYGILLKYSEK